MSENESAFDGNQDQTHSNEAFVPLSDHLWRLPRVDDEGKRTDDATGYKVTDEFSDNEGHLWVRLGREEANGSIEQTEPVPLEVLEQYQLQGQRRDTVSQSEIEAAEATDESRQKIIDMIKRVPGFRERQLEGEAYEQSLDENRREKLLGAQGIIRASQTSHPQSIDSPNRQGRHRLGRPSEESSDNA
jgi:hypothetical protein